MPTLLLNTVLEILAKPTRQEQEIKCIQVKKEEVKLSLCVDDIENPKDSIKSATNTLIK